MNRALKIVPLLSLLLLVPAKGEDQVYWDLETFSSLRALASELAEARPISLAPAGLTLWESGQLKLPESSATTLVGDFNRDGHPDRAVLLETGEGKNLKLFLLIATQSQKRWEMLSLHHLEFKPVGTLLWDLGRKTLAIDTNKTRRRTRPATMTWSGSQAAPRQAQHGYVIEEHRVIPFTWSPERRTFLQGKPYWFEPVESGCHSDSDCEPCGDGCILGSVAAFAECLQPTHSQCGCHKGACRKR